MKTRAELIEEVAWRRRPLEDVCAELGRIEDALDSYTLPLSAVEAAIRARLAGEISERELVDWATFFEARDEVDYHDRERDVTTELLFFLANPEINYSLSQKNLTMMLQKVEQNEN